MSDWNAEQYTKFEKERTQPSIDLISRIDIDPKTIIDIGCGPGNSTIQLFQKYPFANITGIDSSDDMLSKAKLNYPFIPFQKAVIPDDLDHFGSYDLIFSNACLHWIPHHETLYQKLVDHLNPNGVLAVQMPLTQQAQFYRILYTMLVEAKWQSLQAIKNFHNVSPNETYNLLALCKIQIDMWETTYYHVLSSYQAIIDWYKGSGLRPYLTVLSESEKEEFLQELLKRLSLQIPKQADHQVLLKMPRLFFIAKK